MTSHHHEKPSFRNGLIAKAGTKSRTSDDLPSFASQYIPILPPNAADLQLPRSNAFWASVWEESRHQFWNLFSVVWSRARRWRPRDLLNLRLGLILTWIIVLWWGEEGSFTKKIEGCAWDRWETWAHDARPHHVVLIADPQLVDPHTYPDRPWPLSSLTIQYTDLYIRKSFQKISNLLFPDTIFFLGDLFDGGREWTNDRTTGVGSDRIVSDEEQWRKFGQNYWLQEYRRFSSIFFETWIQSSFRSKAPYSRKMIVDLPGNHDLGLGGGIRLPARKRFNVFFGEGNRIDVIGNHTFVSLDTVSLSAKGQIDPNTGVQGVGDDEHNRAIWEPTDEFLHQANALKNRAIGRAIRTQHGLPEYEPQELELYDLNDDRARTIIAQQANDTDVPSIVLTHVPLHRPPGTPCGPLRERYPPSKNAGDGGPLETDEPNSIPYQAGKQYQNVLTPPVSSEIVNLVGDVAHVFSGDDHDYCEVLHREYTSKRGGIREITVKSISWAMGVRHPGFLLVSLWNPVDLDGKSLDPNIAKEGTIQSHLCLLPDQLSIFIRYALLMIFTLLVLILGAFKTGRLHSRSPNGPVLPISNGKYKDKRHDLAYEGHSTGGHSSVHSFNSSSDAQPGLAARGAAGRPSRSTSPGYGIPLDVSSPSKEKMNWNDIDLGGSNPGRGKGVTGVLAAFARFIRNITQVAVVVSIWYAYLLWNS